MEKLLANSKPCHVICFCKFVEIIHNPIMWPRGKPAKIYEAFVIMGKAEGRNVECGCTGVVGKKKG